MNERRWERLGASYGVVFAVLVLLSAYLAPAPPHIDANVSKITAYYTDHRHLVLTAQALGGLAGLAFLLFVGHLRHVLARAERGTEAVAPVILVAGVALPVIAMVGLLPSTLLAVMAGQGTLDSSGLVRAMYDANWLAFGPLEMAGALFVGATSYAMVKGELVEPWLGYAGFVLSAVFLATGFAAFYLGSYSATWMALDVITLGAFAVWTLAASVIMLMRPEEARARQRTPILAPMTT